MEASNKQIYRTPSTMIVEVKQGGVICTSPGDYPKWDVEDI